MSIQCDPKDFYALLKLIKPEDRNKIQVFGILEDGTVEEIKSWNKILLVIEQFLTS